jgi:hypothetical protein
MSTVTEHTDSPRRPALQLAEPAGAADSGGADRHRARGFARGLRVFDAAAVISAAVALATLQSSDFRLTAILAASAVLAKVLAVGGRFWRGGGDHRSPVRLKRVAPRA